MRTWHLAGSCLLPLLAVALGGCLERKERVRVERDGSVELRVELVGDPQDFETGDALPEKTAGWRVHDTDETDAGGNPRRRRVAVRRFAAGTPLPDAYARPDDPQYDAALHFPTTVTIERRPDGTYYHFRRVYHGREKARFEIYRKTLEQVLEPLRETPPDQMSAEQRASLVGALWTFEALKQAEYVMIAGEDFLDRWPQDRLLGLRQAVLEHYRKLGVDRLAELLGEPESPQRNAEIERIGQRLTRGVRELLEQRLRALHVPRSQVREFVEAYDLARAAHAVTEDLSDERWEVRVRLPGEIVAHNADAIENGEAVWHFGGEFLMDRDQVLMVTSRLRPGVRP